MAVELPESEFAADVIATDAFLDLAPGLCSLKYKRENPSSLSAMYFGRIRAPNNRLVVSILTSLTTYI